MIERVRERRTLFVSASLRLLLAALYGIRQIERDAKRCVALPCYAPLPLPHFPTSLSPLLHTVFALSVFVVLFFSLFALLCFGFCVFFCVCVYGSVCVCVLRLFLPVVARVAALGSFLVVILYTEKNLFLFCMPFAPASASASASVHVHVPCPVWLPLPTLLLLLPFPHSLFAEEDCRDSNYLYLRPPFFVCLSVCCSSCCCCFALLLCTQCATTTTTTKGRRRRRRSRRRGVQRQTTFGQLLTNKMMPKEDEQLK